MTMIVKRRIVILMMLMVMVIVMMKIHLIMCYDNDFKVRDNSVLDKCGNKDEEKEGENKDDIVMKKVIITKWR